MTGEERAPYDPMPHGPAEVGVGPWQGEWPTGEQYDERLLAEGDRRNVVDRYRYWRLEAIVADLDLRRHDFHVAIENWQHDFNIGTVVRTANAFLAAEVHIVGNRRWNRRGAMVTDRYQHLRHHPTAADLASYLRRARGAAARHRQPARVGPSRDDGGAPAGVLPVRPGGPGAVAERARRSATGPSRSRSSARPARSTPRPPPRSPCTPGSVRMPTSATARGAAELSSRCGCSRRPCGRAGRCRSPWAST